MTRESVIGIVVSILIMIMITVIMMMLVIMMMITGVSTSSTSRRFAGGVLRAVLMNLRLMKRMTMKTMSWGRRIAVRMFENGDGGDDEDD